MSLLFFCSDNDNPRTDPSLFRRHYLRVAFRRLFLFSLNCLQLKIIFANFAKMKEDVGIMKEEVVAFGEEGCTEVGWLKEELGSNRLWRGRMYGSWMVEGGIRK